MTSPLPDRAESRRLTIATIVFFVAFLLVGVCVFRDYGMSWDEITTRQYGLMNVMKLVPDARALEAVRLAKGPDYERFGPFYEILLVRIEMALPKMDVRSVFMMRHLANFLIFFVGVVAFHWFCRRRFRPGIALVASTCLATIPQLFSHAFYNVKDIAFLTTFMVLMSTLDALLSRPSWLGVLNHAGVTAILIGTRVLGFFGMALTAGATLARRPTWRTVFMLTGYGLVVIVLLPLVWPVLRIDPLGVVRDALLGVTANNYDGTDLFRGRQIDASALPWNYLPTWILITTPFILSALFLVGVITVAAENWARPAALLVQRDLLVCCWFFLPVLGCMILRPIMYDGWRHLFFVYPAFMYLAAIGMETIADRAISFFRDARRQAVSAVLTIALFLCLAPALTFMVVNHPFEHLYFNRLAGRDMQQIKQRYELDYWGLSYRKALEYIMRSDSSAQISVYAANYPGRANGVMLLPRDRARLRFVNSDTAADYFITNYRHHPNAYPYPNEVFSVRVGDASIASVFLLHPKGGDGGSLPSPTPHSSP